MLLAALAALATAVELAFILKRRTMGPFGNPGLWMYLYPVHGWSPLEPAVIIPRLRAMGVTGVIAHSGMTAYHWLDDAHVATFKAAGIASAVGFGMDQHSMTPDDFAAHIVAGFDRTGAVVLDWESPPLWENQNGRALAAAIATKCIAARPSIINGCVDVPWWAPITVPSGGGAHPRAPFKEFGQMLRARYVQAYVYGEGYGAALRKLAWARSSTQYPTLGREPIYGTFQAYGRSYEDVVATLKAERSQILWNLGEMDSACEQACIDVAAGRA